MEKSKRIGNAELVAFLKSTTADTGFVDALKIQYRPYICPFNDLLSQLSDMGAVRVYDIGCGSGQFALLTAQFTSAAKIKGIEIEERLIHNARQIFARYDFRADVDFEKYSGDVLPDDIGNYDVVFLIDVLHHVPKDLQRFFIAQLYARMRNGARLIIKDIDAGSPLVYFNKLHDFLFASEIGNEWNASKLRSVCQELGFKVESLTKKRLYVYPHFTLTLQK